MDGVLVVLPLWWVTSVLFGKFCCQSCSQKASGQTGAIFHISTTQCGLVSAVQVWVVFWLYFVASKLCLLHVLPAVHF